MNDVFVIADTHFGHANMLRFEPVARPFASIEEHDETLVSNWNSVVGHGDSVWHLGDVAFGGVDTLRRIMPRLNGSKRLVLGNHAKHVPFLIDYFTRITGGARERDFLLTHYPVVFRERDREKANIHGHVHSHAAGPGHICVSVEWTDLRPVPLEGIEEWWKARIVRQPVAAEGNA
jgi:calcineurin-like phosphoesterase family protein